MFKFVKPSRHVTRAFIHCTASDNPDHDNLETLRVWHTYPKPTGFGWSDIGYHYMGHRDGRISLARSYEKTPAAQRGHNRATLAYGLHGLAKSKFTKTQLNSLKIWCLQVNEAYGGNITFHGHREVANKACPVIDYQAVLKLDSRGRLGITWDDVTGDAPIPDYGDLSALEGPEAADTINPTLRFGDRGEPVKILQLKLKVLGYHTGAVDGDFGKMTRTSVLAFQADNYLIEDGVFGPASYEALDDAEPKEIGPARARKTVAGLAKDGSRIAQASMAQGVTGTVFSAGGALALLEENSGMVSRMASSLGTYGGVIKALGPWIGAIVVVGGLVVLFQAIKAGRARRDDHRSGKTA